MIAALYVQKDGPYFGIEGVDPWDETRDAREYDGPWPVVAHPPCQLWVNLAGVNFKRHGGTHNRPGNDGGCFNQALRAVRAFGGVLEHPAGSFAWSTFYLHKPIGIGWSRVDAREWVCEVWQSAYGHKARKRTWLLYVGRNPPAISGGVGSRERIKWGGSTANGRHSARPRPAPPLSIFATSFFRSPVGRGQTRPNAVDSACDV